MVWARVQHTACRMCVCGWGGGGMCPSPLGPKSQGIVAQPRNAVRAPRISCGLGHLGGAVGRRRGLPRLPTLWLWTMLQGTERARCQTRRHGLPTRPTPARQPTHHASTGQGEGHGGWCAAAARMGLAHPPSSANQCNPALQRPPQQVPPLPSPPAARQWGARGLMSGRCRAHSPASCPPGRHVPQRAQLPPVPHHCALRPSRSRSCSRFGRGQQQQHPVDGAARRGQPLLAWGRGHNWWVVNDKYCAKCCAILGPLRQLAWNWLPRTRAQPQPSPAF